MRDFQINYNLVIFFTTEYPNAKIPITTKPQTLSRNHSHCKTIQDAITYYRNNQKRMDYALFREQGYFIGSGPVESACKQIVSARLKRAGARWTKPGASAVAKARAAWLSHHWDDLPWGV